MTDRATPFPKLPPAPADPGEYLTHFECIFGRASIGDKGDLSFGVTVLPGDKYMALPLTDIRGRKFRVVVYAEHGRTPIVQDGTLKVYDAQKRVKARAKDRKWRDAKREWFEGGRGNG